MRRAHLLLASLSLIGLQAFAELGPGLNAKQIFDTFKPRWNEVDKCYNDGLATNPDMQGIVRVRFDIGENGDVVKSMIEKSDLKDPATEACLVSFVKSTKFPAPGKGGVIKTSYPFTFKKPKAKK